MRVLIALVLVVIILAACATPAETEPYRIGYIGGLSGDAAAYGATEQNAMTLALEDLEAAGWINGRPLEVIYEDGRCDGSEAAAAAQKLIHIDNVDIILGGLCSGETLAMLPITEQNNVLVFSSFATSPDLSGTGELFFRNAWNDADVSIVAAQKIIEDGHSRLALLSEDTEYAVTLRDSLGAEFEVLGGTIVARETIEQDSKDYRTQITKIKEAAPDAIFIVTNSDVAAGTAIKQIRELGIDVQIYGDVTFSSPAVNEIAEGAATGSIAFDVPGLETPSGKALMTRFEERFPPPSNEFLVGAKYDAVMIIADALGECGEDNNCIKTYLHGLTYEGMIGTYGFDENGDVIGVGFEAKTI